MIDRMLRHNLNLRSLIAMAHDLAAVVTAWWLAYLFRFNFVRFPRFKLPASKEQGYLTWM